MKTIVIGDLHGHDTWKQVLEKEKEWDRVVFLGDYFDSFTKTTKEQVDNFKEIEKLKRENVDRVFLLLGNHDYHYSKLTTQTYSGFRPDRKLVIGEWVNNLIMEGIIQLCYVDGYIWYSHAGFSKTWLKKKRVDTAKPDWWKKLNKKIITRPKFVDFVDVPGDMYGESIEQGPIWIRPESLFEDKPDNEILQVVGHTHVNNVMVGNGVVLCDCLDKGGYAVIEDGNLLLKNLNE